MTSKDSLDTETKYTSSDMTNELIDEITEKIKKIFIELGPEITSKAGISSFVIKKDGSPVTKLDKQIEDKIVKSIGGSFPRLLIYGEEEGYSEDFPEVCLLIDPIDGTKSFIKGIDSYTSMAVLIVNNEAISSVIYNPSTKNMYFAIKDRGAWLNGKILDLSKTELPRTAISKKRHMEKLRKITDLENIDLKTSPSGGGNGFAQVAEGLTAARFQIKAGGYIHDYAPGALLVREAGGTIISLNDTKYSIDSRNFIACHPKLKNLFENNIKKLKAI